MGMRVISGSLRGRKLKTLPKDKTRPSTGKVREAIFSSLQAVIPASTCLDLCAGSGSMGIEALSRGAAFCHFVDNHFPACKVLRANIEGLALEGRASVHCMDVGVACRLLARDWGKSFDIVFLDPPYSQEDVYLRSVGGIETLLRSGGIIVIEHSPHNLHQIPYAQYLQTKNYGSTAVSYYRNGGD